MKKEDDSLETPLATPIDENESEEKIDKEGNGKGKYPVWRIVVSVFGQFILSMILADLTLLGSATIYFVSYLRIFTPHLITTEYLLPS